jgi:lysophospholipase L1-like esterase
MRSQLALSFVVVAGLVSSAVAQTPYTYLAIGDSVGFGITNGASYTQPSNGDRGYVSLYADYLATQNAGLRPTVVNASIFGDDSTSFSNLSNPARALNTNYPPFPGLTTQANFITSTITQAALNGAPVQRVTISLGANDLLGVVQLPGFITLPEATQAALVFGALNTAQTNIGTIYATLRAALPTAEIIAVGYYDPFAILPGNPNPAFTAGAVNALNQIIQASAASIGARYVETASAFLGNEATLTNMLLDQTTTQPNVHPTAAGYRVIANQIIPAPGAAFALAFGILAHSRRRRASAMSRA